jgi:hypothetical protein
MATLFLFSSISRERYLQDSLDVLALPHKARVHFRYNQRWVAGDLAMKPNEVIEQYASRLESYKGMKSLVTLVDLSSTNSPSTQVSSRHFYPLRLAQISSLEPDGTVLHAYFELDEYIDWRMLTMQEADSYIEQHLTDSAKPPLKFIAVSTSSPPYVSGSTLPVGNSAQSWEAAISVISQLQSFDSTVFYRISGMREVIGPSFASKLANILWRDPNTQHRYRNISLSEVLPRRPGYVLRGGRVYLLDLSFFQPKDPTPPIQGSYIKPTLDASLFTFIPQDIEINFRYDKHSIPIVCKPVTEDTLTLMRIDSKEDQNGVHPTRSPEINLLFRITYPRVGLYIGFGVLLIAQIMIALSGKIGEVLKGTNLPVDQQALADPLLAVGGAVLTTVTLFFLLRRLPGT